MVANVHFVTSSIEAIPNNCGEKVCSQHVNHEVNLPSVASSSGYLCLLRRRGLGPKHRGGKEIGVFNRILVTFILGGNCTGVCHSIASLFTSTIFSSGDLIYLGK